VKTVHLFASGFSEAGEEEAGELEREVVGKGREGGFRLIGPNCIGVYSPYNRMPYGPGENLMGEVGSAAFISQSGGQGANLLGEGIRRGIGFSKGISYGNGADLDSTDFLEYLALDPETKVIAIYIEGVRDGRRLFQVLREAAKVKPVVVCKGGRTEAGTRAAASHTGSLAGSDIIWDAALKQAGAIKVGSIEELADILLAFQRLPPLKEANLAVIGGLADGAGGFSVAATDACVSQGLNVPPFTAETRRQLKAIIPGVGIILQNPIDTGGALINDLGVFQRMFEAVVANANTNLVLLVEPIDFFLRYISKEIVYALNDAVINLSSKKPFVIVSPPSLAESERVEVERKFTQAGLPIYPSTERAAKVISNVIRYWRFRDEIGEADGSARVA
jgi:acyl-CoA synthetase (NDP forming)